MIVDQWQDEWRGIMDRERIARDKITQMLSDTHKLKNRARLEQELQDCDQRISFVERMMASGHCDLESTSGYACWNKTELNLSRIMAKVRDLSLLYIREEKLREAYARAIATDQLRTEPTALKHSIDQAAGRMGLIKEVVDRYTSLLPPSILPQILGHADGDDTDNADAVAVRKSKGRLARAVFEVSDISIDRFDDTDLCVELYANNELVIAAEGELVAEGVLPLYNSHAGAKLELYIYDASNHHKAVALAAFSIVSVMAIKERVFLEPRGHLHLAITFKPLNGKTELRRAAAVTRARVKASRFAVHSKHRFQETKNLAPRVCAHCRSFSLLALYTRQYECVDCGFFCHKSDCSHQLVAECLPNADGHKTATLATFDLPHRFVEQHGIFQPAWCSHCGHMVNPLGRANLRCEECLQWCHPDCSPYIPAHCGLTRKLKKALPLTASLDRLQDEPDRLGAYEFIKTIGRGSFGKVIVARQRGDGRLVAIKILKKNEIKKHGETENVKTEYRVLNMIKRHKSHFCIGLLDVFQSTDRVYLVSEFVAGGDLMFHIQSRPFTEAQVRFIAAQVMLGLDFLHKHGVIYRDLKLDNVLIGLDGYVKLADFGLSKDGMFGDHACTRTFCGTPEFMAPEIVREQPYGRAIDWWAFGVCLYELLTCQAPFPGDCEDDIYESILEHRVAIPEDITPDARDLILKCLERDPRKRIGGGPFDAAELRRHPFFASIDFAALHNKQLKAPFIPPSSAGLDVHHNFDPEFTVQSAALSPIASTDMLRFGEDIVLTSNGLRISNS